MTQPERRTDGAMQAGGGLIFLGALVLLLDLFNYELLILSWLGSFQVPVGWGMIVVGVLLIVVRRMQGVPFSAMNDDSGMKKAPAPASTTPAMPVPNQLSGAGSAQPSEPDPRP